MSFTFVVSFVLTYGSMSDQSGRVSDVLDFTLDF